MIADPALAPFPSGPMAVTRLSLAEFRCYPRLRLDLDARPVVLTGANGAGKTNLLEALSFLAPGRGLRRARLAEVGRLGADPATPWAVAATLATPDGPTEIGTAHEPPSGPVSSHGEARDGKRAVQIDGKPSRGQAQLARLVSVVWLTPDMDRLFADGASARRRFLDRLVYGFDPEHARRVSTYDHAMRERVRVLRAPGPPPDEVWLAALEDRMAREGVAISVARRMLADRLGRAIALADGPFPKAGLRVAGTVEAWLDEGPALAAEDRLRAALAASRAHDAASGGAAAGPHRGDLEVRHLERDRPAGLCSTGEQKALLLSIVLANARLRALERGAPPILLLDEVAAHLDADRRAALYADLLALGAQAWLTGTDASLFEPLASRAQFFRVADATVNVSENP